MMTRRQAFAAIVGPLAGVVPAIAQRLGGATNLKVVTLSVAGMT